ncbi:MAG: hypothetical protein ABIR81_06345 [Ginsengibacter sp.]
MKNSQLVFRSITLFLIVILFNGCVKDTCKKMYSYSFYQPVYKTAAEVRANIKNSVPREIENAGKVYIKGNYIFLNEVDKGIHIIDNSNPSSPVNTAFIDIPGNLDLAVKGNSLYADLYTDLVTIDISDPLHVVTKKFNEGVFPYRAYANGFSGDTSRIIVDWIKSDTMVEVSCGSGEIFFEKYGFFSAPQANSVAAGGSKNSGSPIGQSGSMARFTIVNNRMYTVSNTDLSVFDIADANNPVYTNALSLNSWMVETIFPFKNKLFIGTQAGMFTFNVNRPDHPEFEGQFEHVRSCDPVIADDDYAYVTLSSGSTCQGFNNQLDIIKLNDFADAQLIKTYQLTNPHGLSKDGNLLFICDGTDGLKVFDARNVNYLSQVKQFSGLETYDVIAYNNIALVVAKDGIYQYDYSNANNIHLLSKTNFAD